MGAVNVLSGAVPLSKSKAIDIPFWSAGFFYHQRHVAALKKLNGGIGREGS